MKERQRIAIYIDYTIRIPNFKQSYESFKTSLFKDNLEIELPEDFNKDDIRFFWLNELKKPEIENFYISKTANNIEDSKINGNFGEYFYNDQHLAKFFEDYTFNLYSDCEVTSRKDIDLLNIAQKDLFDVTLIDEYKNSRKISNTFYFLAKTRIYPRNVIFLGPNQEINKENFIGIWNPIENKEQYNNNTSTKFLDWLQELEKKVNENL